MSATEWGFRRLHGQDPAAGPQPPALTEAELAEIVKKVGLPRSKGGKIPIDMERVRLLRDFGFSKRQIGELLEVSKATIERRLAGR